MKVVYPSVIVGLLLLGACGSDSDSETSSNDVPTAESTAEVSGSTASSNACPPEGCEITITTVEPAGDELAVTWTANFLPDFSRNHIHVFWDDVTADQVSSDAESRGVEQAAWTPTDDYPVFTTGSETSLETRPDSTTLCVTAADRDHVVLDSSIVHCMDVSAQLP